MDNMSTRLLEVVTEETKLRKSSGVEYIDWDGVSRKMAADFPNEYNSKERWRSAYRRLTSKEWLEQHDRGNTRSNIKRTGATSLQAKLAVYLSNKKVTTDAMKTFGITEDQLFSEVTRMRLKGYDVEIWLEDGTTYMQLFKKVKDGEKEIRNLFDGHEFKIGLLSCTHFGHEKADKEALAQFYEYAHSKGVVDFYHAGDIVDGYYKNRDDSIYEQYAIGFDNQLQDVVDNYPQIDGVTTYFITGNHDVTHVRNGGANIGKAIAQMREDMVYLGHNFAKVWLTEKVDLNLLHPGDGAAYSVSLRAQKIVDSASGKRKAKIMGIGHYHKMDWIFWKGTHAFTLPSFERQTSFMEAKNLKSYVGAYILTIKVDPNGELLTVMPEYVDFE